MLIDFSQGGLKLVFEVDEEKQVLLKHFSCKEQKEGLIKQGCAYAIGDIHVTGENQSNHHGGKHTGHSGERTLRYVSHRILPREGGRTLEILLTDGKMNATCHYEAYHGIAAVRAWVTVENISKEEIGLEYVPAFTYTGLCEGECPTEETFRVYVPHSGWLREGNWQEYSLTELGYDRTVSSATTKRISFTNTGTWSSKEYLPMGAVCNGAVGNTVLFQIEHNGSWHWELGDRDGRIYLKIAGPTERENHWYRALAPGERFEGVKAGLAVGEDLGAALAEMTKYRRTLIRNNAENAAMPVIFNDYMNCLGAQPTEENEPPIIDIAASLGAEYYCMDAGWYADGDWWDSVGEWQPSAVRFPHGIERIFDYVRKKGMIPGIWLEIEVMGINCPLAKAWPDECFFVRHGKRVIDNGRYQLDFRHPLVQKHATEVVDRVVKDYGVGYIKMDYNIDGGIGTEVDADSFGDGLLGHNRAYLDWLRTVKEKHPSLIIECCSSGGMRMDYAMLGEGHLQSVSDATDYLKNATVAAAAPMAVLPEQGAIWAYPKEKFSDDAVALNMINAMLQRIHLSGKVWDQTESGLALMKEAVACYKTFRHEISSSVPFYPLGLPHFHDGFLCLAFRVTGGVRMAVWRMGEGDTVHIPVSTEKGNARVIYPKGSDCVLTADTRGVTVTLPRPHTAVLIELH